LQSATIFLRVRLAGWYSWTRT